MMALRPEVVACRSTAIVPDGSQPFVMRWRHDDVRALRSLAWVGLVGVLVAGCASSSPARAGRSLAGSAVSSPALGCVVVRGELTGVTSSAGLVIADQLTTFIVACTVGAWGGRRLIRSR